MPEWIPDEPETSLTSPYPGWHVWRGISGLVYARKLMSSPPVIMRDHSVDGLASQIRIWYDARPEERAALEPTTIKPPW